jgi:hypothetical protein
MLRTARSAALLLILVTSVSADDPPKATADGGKAPASKDARGPLLKPKLGAEYDKALKTPVTRRWKDAKVVTELENLARDHGINLYVAAKIDREKTFCWRSSIRSRNWPVGVRWCSPTSW